MTDESVLPWDWYWKGFASVLTTLAAAEGLVSASQVVANSYPGPRPMRPSELLKPANW